MKSTPHTPDDAPDIPHADKIDPSLEGMAVSIAGLSFDPANARKHDRRNLDAIKGSLAMFGQRKPIVVRRQGMVVIAGNGTLESAKELGWARIAAVVVDDDTATATAYAIADNRTAELAKWDEDTLGTLLGGLRDTQIKMEDLGFSEQEQVDLIGMVDAVPVEGDPDEVPAEQEREFSQRGEVFELGPHRLMCGDSTSEEDWQSLLGSEIADAVMTDPPYGVGYVGGDRNPCGNNAYSGDTVENDEKDPDKLRELIDAVFAIMAKRCKDGGSIYVAHSDTMGHVFRASFVGAGFKLAGCVIWVKSAFVFGRSDYKWQHEPILYGWKEGAAHTWNGPANESTVWDYRRPSPSAKEHPTMKPVELYERMMNNSTLQRQTILEPFGGSGTTLIAAARTGRICRAMEIAPRYCDVIRRRWTKFAKENNMTVGTGGLE